MASTLNKPVTSQDFLNSTGFIVTIERAPNTTFFCDSVSIPGVSCNPAEQPTPFTRIPVTADHPDFDQLTISFKVNEDLTNWIEIYNWIIGTTFPETFEQFKDAISYSEGGMQGKESALFSDISVLILSSHKNPLVKITYHRCTPVDISGFDMTSDDTTINPVVCTASFQFTHFTVEKIV